MRRLLLFVSALLALAGILAVPAAAADRSVCFNPGIGPDTAIEACGRMISSGLELAKAYEWRAYAYSKKADYDRAIADYNEAIKLAPSAIAHRNRGLAYGKKANHDRAIADYSGAIRLDPKHVNAYYDRGLTYYNKGDYDRAIADATEAIKLDPNIVRTHILRGSAYNEKGDYDRAIADATEAIRLDPKLAIAYVNRAFSYTGKRNYDSAIADATEAILLNPSVAAYVNRGRAYSLKGDYDRAVTDTSEAIRLDPKNVVANVVAYANRASFYTSKGDYDRAIADYNEALRLDPRDVISYNNRADVYGRKGEYDRAIADYNEALRLNPKYTGAHFNRGRAYEARGDFANALTDFRSALVLAPNDTYAGEAVRRMEHKLAARAEPKPPAKSDQPATVPGQPETRIALVIGNGAYAGVGALANPGNDARAIEATLKKIGFTTVTLQLDLPRERLLDALKSFAREAEKADWALVYFAGHGLELGGINYLVPVDAKLASDRDAAYEAVELQRVLDAVSGAKRIGLVILDACRDNPFSRTMTRSMASTRSIGRGLAQIEPEGATLVAYAAKHGQVAMDGTGSNSPFVTALIKNLETPGLEINLLFRKVRDDVLAATGRRQEPFVYSSLPGEAFYFRKP